MGAEVRGLSKSTSGPFAFTRLQLVGPVQNKHDNKEDTFDTLSSETLFS